MAHIKYSYYRAVNKPYLTFISWLFGAGAAFTALFGMSCLYNRYWLWGIGMFLLAIILFVIQFYINNYIKTNNVMQTILNEHLEQYRKALESGEITQEQYNSYEKQLVDYTKDYIKRMKTDGNR